MFSTSDRKFTFDAQKAAMLEDLDTISRALKVDPEPEYVRAPPRTVGRICYLPIEVAGRELLGKTRIAKELLELGFQVVLGAQWPLTKTRYLGLPPGIILFKTLNALDALKMHWAQTAGHIAAPLDEELCPIRPRLNWYRAVTNQSALNVVDMLCAPGDRSRDMFRKITTAQVDVTGNPRCHISNVKPGNDILVCTMAGLANSARAFHETIILICRILQQTAER